MVGSQGVGSSGGSIDIESKVGESVQPNFNPGGSSGIVIFTASGRDVTESVQLFGPPTPLLPTERWPPSSIRLGLTPPEFCCQHHEDLGSEYEGGGNLPIYDQGFCN